jgi:hypothetical protein
MKTTDYAYAAGYIDGDGCFQIGNKKWGSHLVVVSVRKEPIIWFADRFDGSVRAIHPRTINRHISYHFRFTYKGLKHLHNIAKFLVEKKYEYLLFEEFRSVIGEALKEPITKVMDSYKENANLIHRDIKEDLSIIKNTIKPTEEDFAYLAGYIDSECSLDINRTMQKRGKTFTYRPQLQCNNTKSPFFYWASERFGGQFHFLNKKHIPNCRNQMLWRISNLQLDPILECIYPYLVSKKHICEKMMQMRKKILSKDRLDRENIYNQSRHLNNTI